MPFEPPLVADSFSNVWLSVLLGPLLCFLYVWLNDAKLTRLPPEAVALSPDRWTEEGIRKRYAELTDGPNSPLEDKLPPKTGRRYIVTGGVRDIQAL